MFLITQFIIVFVIHVFYYFFKTLLCDPSKYKILAQVLPFDKFVHMNPVFQRTRLLVRYVRWLVLQRLTALIYLNFFKVMLPVHLCNAVFLLPNSTVPTLLFRSVLFIVFICDLFFSSFHHNPPSLFWSCTLCTHLCNCVYIDTHGYVAK